jgi:hypothetical protein
MSENIIAKLRAMLNSNGRTPEEAATFRAKAEELIKKYRLEHVFAEALKAKPKAKKARTVKPKAAKPVKDDGRMRKIMIRKKGEKRWNFHENVRHPDLKAALKALRDAGYEAKSQVVK